MTCLRNRQALVILAPRKPWFLESIVTSSTRSDYKYPLLPICIPTHHL